MNGYAQLFVNLEQFRIDFVERFQLRLRGGVILDRLKIDGRILGLGPLGFFHGQPVAVGFETPVEKPLGFFFLMRNKADDLFAEAGGGLVGFNINGPTPFIFLSSEFFDGFG